MKKLRVVAIVQARMGATRLPGKPLKEVLKRPLLSYQIERLRQSKAIDEIVIATTLQARDQAIVDLCQKEHVSVFRGSETDVLDRYYQAAIKYTADVVVRITADCPVIDPVILDGIVGYFIEHFPQYDYVSTGLPGQLTFPRGLDVEVFSFAALEKAAIEAKEPEEREHVTPYLYLKQGRFKVKGYTNPVDESHHRWTVDTDEDFQLIEHILTELYPKNPNFRMKDVLALLKEHPEWVEINRHIKQKTLKLNSN